MKKVAIIGTAGVPSRYGGFETLAHQLVLNLNKEHDLYVYCSGQIYQKHERKKTWNGANLIFLPFNANGIQSIIYDIISIIHALFFADVLIVLGVSGGILFPLIKWWTKKKIIVNIDGLEWKRPKWNSLIKKYLKLSERLAVKFSDADITDNLAIKKYTARTYNSLSLLVEYGADHADEVKFDKTDVEQYPFLAGEYAFKVCRIEPENNLDMVLEAFQKTEMPLVIVGNWNNSKYGVELKEKYSKLHNYHLLDPIYEQTTLDKLRSNASIYVHGHSAGGTNPSLVEAMYLGLSILAFDVDYNRATTENKARYFSSADQLTDMLQQLTDTDLQILKHHMREIAMRRYTWKVIAGKYNQMILSFDFSYERKKTYGKFHRMDPDTLLENGMGHLNKIKLFYE